MFRREEQRIQLAELQRQELRGITGTPFSDALTGLVSKPGESTMSEDHEVSEPIGNLPSAWVEVSGAVAAWWVEGVALVVGATGAALVWTGLTGVSPDWIDEDR